MATGAVVEAGVGEVVAGSLDGDSLAGASAAGAVVALEADGESRRGFEEAGVRRAVGLMAAFATIDADGGVFEDEGAAFVDVAFEAGLFVAECLLHHVRAGGGAPGGGRSAMGIVAVGAVHEAFVDAVFERHGELGADVGVAGVAKVGLLLGEQGFGSGGFVDGVAGRANDVGGGVAGAAYVLAAERLLVAGQAVVEDLLGLHDGESLDGGFAAFGFQMFFGGAVAGLAGLLEFGVGVFEKYRGHVRVAGTAGVGLSRQGEWGQQRQQDEP